MTKKTTPTKKKPVKKKAALQKLVFYGESHQKALIKFAKEHGLTYGGKPNLNAALRLSSAIGLGDPTLADSVECGRRQGYSPKKAAAKKKRTTKKKK